MKRQTYLFLVAAILCALSVGVSYADPEWVESWGIDFWNLPKMNSRMNDVELQNHRLNQIGDSIARRIAIRESIGDDVVQKRITLESAANQFEDLNRTFPPIVETIRYQFESTNETYLARRQLVEYLKTRAPANLEGQELLRQAVQLAEETPAH